MSFDYSSGDSDSDEIDVELQKTGIEEDKVEDPIEANKVDPNEENKVDVPKEGMEFISLDEMYGCYSRYARKIGFSVIKRNVKRGANRKFKCLTLACSHAGKPKRN